MDKNVNEIQKQLEVSMAFMKAAAETKEKKAERDKRIREKAVKAAEVRRREKAEREAYEAWHRDNPPTEEEKAEHRRIFKELLGRSNVKGGGSDD